MYMPRPDPIEYLNIFYFYITSTNSLHCFFSAYSTSTAQSAEDGLHCPVQIRHLDLDAVQEDPNIFPF